MSLHLTLGGVRETSNLRCNVHPSSLAVAEVDIYSFDLDGDEPPIKLGTRPFCVRCFDEIEDDDL